MAPFRSTGEGAGPRLLFGALLAAALLAANGCAVPESTARRIDKGQAAISRGIADVVDAADRAFGEPRVSDREKLVQVKVGAAVRERENNGTALVMPVSLRVPLPALERWANIFLSVDSVADSLRNARAAAAAFNDNKTVTAAVISQFTNSIHAGLKLDVIWDKGPQTGLRPFVRWQWLKDPVRVFVEQQVYDRTNQWFGEKTLVQFNRVLGGPAFVRLLTSLETNQHDPGRSFEHAVIYRRLFPRQELVLSAELGARHNPYVGDPETKTPGIANDTDEGYLQFRATGKVYRPWLEYEVTPMAHLPWQHRDVLEFGITFELRFVYESFLRGPKGGPPAAVPSPQPNW